MSTDMGTDIGRQKLLSLLDQSPVALAMMEGPRHKLVFTNRAYIDLLFSGREIVGQDVAVAAPEVVAQGFVDLLDNVFRTGEVHHGEEVPIILRQKNGEQKLFILNFTYQPMRNENGEIDGVLAVVQEVTEQVRGREAIEDQQRWLENILNRMPSALFIIDPKTSVIKFANKSAERLVSAQVENTTPEFRTKTYVKVYDTEGRSVPDSQIPSARAARGEELVDEEFVIETRAGRFDITASTQMIPASHGHQRTALLVLNDVTAVKAAEEQFKLFAELAPQMPFIADAQGRISYVSHQWYSYTGNPPRLENSGWHQAPTHCREDLPTTLSTWNESLRLGKPYETEYRLRRADGAYRWHLGRATPVRNAEGVITKWFGTNVDIHDQKMTSERLAESESKFRFLANAMPQIVFTAAADGELNYVNRRWIDYSGSEDPAAWFSFVHPRELDKVVREWKTAVRALSPFESEFRLKRKSDGEYRWHLVRAVAVHDDAARGTRWYGTCTDVTEQKDLQSEIQDAKTEAENANQAKSAFLANMSHEIRTPLGAILGFTDLLKSAKLQGEEAEYLNVIERNGHALTRVIDDILDLSKVESGQMTIELVPFSLEELVRDVAALFNDKAKAKGIFLETRGEESLPHTVVSDPARVRQILINLVGNAVKFTSEGGITITANHDVKPRDHARIEIRIEDSGPGMNDEQRTRLFQPFVQADNSTTRKFGGTGLGLALSRRLAKALGGDVRVEKTEPGKGSTFLFEVEVETDSKMVAAPEMREILPGTDSKVNRLEGLNILVVDDSPDNRVLMNLILRREGAVVDDAADGEEAVRKAVKGEFDVVLMDIQMPGMDGYTALVELKQQKYNKPVIALTAHAMNEERRRTAAAGFTDHVTKPVDQEVLVNAILRQVRS